MFNIKRFDLDAPSTESAAPAPNDRLAKLNARLNKNKKVSTTESSQEQAKDHDHHSKDRTREKDGVKKDPNVISFKRSREEEELKEAKRQAAADSSKHKKWEKKAKELKDSDLIPNDVRLAMKAEAEAAKKDWVEPILPVVPTVPVAAIASESKDLDGEGDEDMAQYEHTKDDQDKDQEMEGVKQFVDDAEVDAALADLALVPLPTFEAKEISATEKERAKSMGVPDWLAHPTTIKPETNTPIDSPLFGFSKRLIKQCEKEGITECFAVQTAVIPVLMRARHLGDIRRAPGDLCVSAPTGSGKTLAYVLPIIEILSQRVVTRLRALVVLPTRDLCVQVKETFETFVKGTDLKIATSTGQNSFAHEQGTLVGNVGHDTTINGSLATLGGHSRVDVLITTPGRLIDHIKSTPNFTLQHLRFLVIDEADRLLNQSFQDWLYHILTAIHPQTDTKLIQSQVQEVVNFKRDQYGFPVHDAIAPGFLPSFFHLPESDVEDPKALSVQKLLFSATLTRNPAKIASLQLSDPKYVAVQEGQEGEDKQKYTTPAGLTEHMIVCETSDKPLMVLHLLHHVKVRSALCFTKSVESAHRLYRLVQLYEKQRMAPKSEKVQAQDKDAESKGESSESDSSDSESDSDSDSSSDSGDEVDQEMEPVQAKVLKDSKGEDQVDDAMEVDPDLKNMVEALAQGGPIVVAEYSSDLPKAKRVQILKEFKEEKIHLLICSDLISRGMDLSNVQVVINYDSPVYMKKYIHRVGRTARAGKTGTAYSLVEMQEARHFKEMIAKAGHWEKIKRVQVKGKDLVDLVPDYQKALGGLREALSSQGKGGRAGGRRGGEARRAKDSSVA